MKIKKIAIGILAILLLVVAGALLFLQMSATDIIRNYVARKLPHHITLVYGDLSVNLFSGTVEVAEVSLQISERDTLFKTTEVTTDKLRLAGLDYWAFYMKDQIIVDEIFVNKPVYRHFGRKKSTSADTTSQGVVPLLKQIHIKKIRVDDGQFVLMGEQEDSTKLVASDITFELLDGRTDPDRIRRMMPFTYQAFTFSSSNIFVDLGPYELMQIAELDIKKNHITIGGLKLTSKFTRIELSRRAEVERDHISLEVPQTTVADISFGFHGSRFFARADSISILQPRLEIYRDKGLPDDESIKKLYTEMLRGLSVDIETSLLSIHDGYVMYEEKIDEHPKAGGIFIDDIDLYVRGLDNQMRDSTDQRLRLDATAKLMGSARVELKWDLHLFDPGDRFLISGAISDFRCSEADIFIRPMLGVEAEGYIHKMYFTFAGDKNTSSGDMKMNYEDFKFMVLAKDGQRVNKFLTAIGNLFINDGSKADEDGFRFGTISVERNKTKSFFNYIWLNIKEGIMNAITGKGKEDK